MALNAIVMILYIVDILYYMIVSMIEELGTGYDNTMTGINYNHAANMLIIRPGLISFGVSSPQLAA